MNIFSFLNEKYKKWKEKRFLKMHGVSSWKDYNYYYDKDRDNTQTLIKKIYHGYKVIIVIPNPKFISDIIGVVPDSQKLWTWANQNCESKFRIDVVPIYETKYGELVYGGNVGSEEIIVAFKNKEDAINFIMTYDGTEIIERNKKTILIYN